MGKVQRYGQDWEYEPSKVIKREEGPYVLYADYRALKAVVAALVEAAKVVFGRVEFTKNYPVYDRIDSILESIDKLKAEVKRLKDENGNMDSMYQDRLLDMEAKVYKAEAKLAALVEAAESLSIIIPENDPIWKRAADKLKTDIDAAKEGG